MTDRLNYASHAIENIQQQLDQFKIDEPLVSWTLDHLVSAEKFILPDRGELLDLTSFNQQHADLIKLPYPVTLIEAPFPPRPEQRLTATKDVSSRRIGLYIEMSSDEVSSNFEGAERPAPNSTGVLVIAIYYVDEFKMWEVSACGSYVAYNQKVYNSETGENTSASRELLAEVNAEGRKFSKMAIRSSLVPLRPIVLLNMRKGGMSDSQIASAMLGNLLDEQIMMTQLCTALSRSDVKLTDVPVPEKLARRREKMGKIPLYDYTAVALPG